MSSNLDKLKALTSRLEEKIEMRNKSLFDDDMLELTPKEVLSDQEETKSKPTHKEIVETYLAYDTVRAENIERLRELYEKLKIYDKSPIFKRLFDYKAMNLSGISLKEDDFGEVREGKYVQIIAITYEPDKSGKKRAKNSSLGYFGKAEALPLVRKSEIIEFVLRWRYEKAFQNVEYYRELIERVKRPVERLF